MAKSPVTIAELNQRVAIQKMTRVSDGQGGWTTTWATIATVWAKIKPKGGREQYFGEAVREVVTHEICIRKRNDVTTADMRLLHGSVIYQLKGKIKYDARNFFMYINAEEGVAS